MIKSAASIVSDVLENKLHQTIIEREIIQHSILSKQDPEGKESYFKREMFKIQESVKRNLFFPDWVNNGFRCILEEPKLSRIIEGIDRCIEERASEMKADIEASGGIWTEEMFERSHNRSEVLYQSQLDKLYPEMVVYDALRGLLSDEKKDDNISRWFTVTQGRDVLLGKIREKMNGKKGARLVEIYLALRINGQVREIQDREIADFFHTIKDVCGFNIGTDRNFLKAYNNHGKNSYPKGYIEGLAMELK